MFIKMIRGSCDLKGKKLNKLHDLIRQVLLKDGSTVSVYPLIVATSSFGLRGDDYRSHIGITLIVAKSFDHERDAIQAMNRVGRWDEPFRRIVAGDIAIVDSKSAFAYSTALNKFNNDMSATAKLTQMATEIELEKKLEEKKV